MPTRITQTGSLSYEWRDGGNAIWQPRNKIFNSVENLALGAWSHMPINTNIDDGGPFLVERTMDRVAPGNSQGMNYYRGGVTVSGPNGFTGKTVSPVTSSALNARGTTAIARSLPTNSAFEMSTFLGEILTGGIPAITGLATMKNRAQVARSAGQEYLNVQFGWLPLISDVREFAKAVRDADEIIANYRKGSGAKIRRRYSFPDAVTSTRTWSGSFFPDPWDFSPAWQYGQLVEEYSSKTWFSGAFKYHIPVGTSALDKFARWRRNADLLLGVSIDPETLWNIAPWSWAVDWFTNVGDVMTNISAMGKDGLVLQYGYIMDHRFVKTRMFATHWSHAGTTREVLREYKMRLPATPYGFGVNLNALSGKQVAILAALGLSRT